MDHDEPGRPRRGAVTRSGRPSPSRTPARRSGGSRRGGAARGGSRPPRSAGPPQQRTRPAPSERPFDHAAAGPGHIADHDAAHAFGEEEPPRSEAPPPPRTKRGNAGKRGGRGGLKGPKLYFTAAGALVAAVVVLLALLVATREDEPAKSRRAAPPVGRPAAAGGPSPVSYSSSPSTAAYQAVARRTSDAAPLTAAEMFSGTAASVRADGGARLTLRAKRLDPSCAQAVWGLPAAEELARGRCTQAARALYADTRKGYALTVAVFNLATVDDADRLVEALGRVRGGGFVRPLSADEPLDRFGQGYGMARGLAIGHYAVVAWAQRVDGKGNERDETLLTLLIEGGKSPGVLGRVVRAD
ncbi:hypothetical protein ACQEU3_31690 [Spirillospora sp. CA-253888]